jgi:hypothetical protein
MDRIAGACNAMTSLGKKLGHGLIRNRKHGGRAMSQMLKKRTPRTTSTLPPYNTLDGHACRFDGRPDAAALAHALRCLAVRAYRAVKAAEKQSGTPSAAELLDLRSEIRRLQSETEAQGLHYLAAYVAALRQEVEAKLL